MPRTDDPLDQKSAFPGRLSWGAIVAVGSILCVLAIWLSPPNSFHPMCTYEVNATLTADVVIEGQKLSSTVIHQNSHSRGWISGINSAGCKQWYGTALTFKLANDSVLIVPSQICLNGRRELARSGRVDVLSSCTGKQANQNSAFIVDSASHPRKWKAVTNGIEFQFASMTAVSTWKSPSDDIASIAPNLLKSNFKYGRQQWSNSPEKVISFSRRYSERHDKSGQAFEFEVENE
ncbi:MAG TPA: hypothetical protein VFV47_15070 [Hyphomicrobiaceae bacterium]|nr:hypothetical protein [Hyphomicrobiaceae bacterium]